MTAIEGDPTARLIEGDGAPAAERADAIEAALERLKGDDHPTRTPRPAPNGVRFSDVPLAVAMAATDAEMAVIRRVETDGGGLRFELKTLNGYPAKLEVTPTGDDRVLTATASVGRFGDRTGEADELLERFREWLERYGAKPQLYDD